MRKVFQTVETKRIKRFAKLMSRRSKPRKGLNEKIFTNIIKPGKYTTQQVLSALKTPTLILWGKEDRVIDVSSVSKI